MEAELLALAQAASGEARDAALEAAHKARLDEAEAQRSKAEESSLAKESALREAQQLLEEAEKPVLLMKLLDEMRPWLL